MKLNIKTLSILLIVFLHYLLYLAHKIIQMKKEQIVEKQIVKKLSLPLEIMKNITEVHLDKVR